MKIRISDIAPKGLAVKGTLELAPLNERMSAGRGAEIQFLTPPVVDLMVTRTVSGAELKGTVSSRYLQPCARCLEGKERAITVSVELTLIQRDRPFAGGRLRDSEMTLVEESLASQEEDIGVVFFQGDSVEVEGVLQEALILELSLFWSPPLDTAGRCTLCHLSLEELSGGAMHGAEAIENTPPQAGGGTKLGELLESARTTGKARSKKSRAH